MARDSHFIQILLEILMGGKTQSLYFMIFHNATNVEINRIFCSNNRLTMELLPLCVKLLLWTVASCRE